MSRVEYLHDHIECAEEYSYESVQTELNRLGQQGWKLVNITPEWEWSVESISQEHLGGSDMGGHYYNVEAPYAFPDYITGWYCTFKRPLD